MQVPLNADEHYRIGYGGGAMILECKKCKKYIAVEDVAFPGTKEQQAPIREKFEEVKKLHKCL